MQKFIIYFALFALLAIVLLALFAPALNFKKSTKPEGWMSPENWKKLEKGMTQQQVEQILGKPKQIIRRAAQRWYYQEAPREIHVEPNYGYVTFWPKGDPNSLVWYVTDWVEPEWRKMQTVPQKK